MNALLDALGFIGNVADTPGSVARGLLAGDPGAAFGGVFDPSRRLSGRDMLERLGALGANEEGLDFGDVAGFGAELATDPLNWLGAAGIGKVAGMKNAAAANNARREMMLAKGAMPEEIAALTKVADEAGNPLRTFHGTPYAYDAIDAAKFDRNAAYGPGYYTTADPSLASEYASLDDSPIVEMRNNKEMFMRGHERNAAFRREDAARYAADPERAGRALQDAAREDALAAKIREELAKMPELRPNVRTQFLDVRNPFDLEATYPANTFGSLPEASGKDLFRSLQGYGMPDAATAQLRDLGYDGIKHLGGQIVGDRPHDVFIAFDPSQVYAPWVAPAAKSAPPLSPLLAALGLHNLQARGL